MAKHTPMETGEAINQLASIITDHQRLLAINADLLAALKSIAEHGDQGSREVAQEAIAKAEEGS